MARLISPSCKICRAAGEKLFLKGERCFTQKCAIIRRNYRPGIHGQERAGMLSEYNVHLKEKQKVKRIYGLLERQFEKYFYLAAKKLGETGEALIGLLELRLDNVVFRLKLAPSRAHARSLVSHGHIRVNGKRVTIPSYQVKIKDKIEVKEESRKNKYFQELLQTIKSEGVPNWLKLDAKNLRGEVVSLPSYEDLDKKFNTSLIVEYYSK